MSHGWLRIVLLVGFLVLAVSGAGAMGTEPRPVTVAYEVTGSGPVEVRYADADGALAAPAFVTLPWRTQFTVTDGVPLLTMSAARKVSADGDITCRITVDGTLVALDGLGGYAQCTGDVNRR